MRAPVRLSLAALALACLVLAAPAAAGQIVYSHGGDLWVMNDDGSGQRPLASAAQIGGAIDAGSTADPQPVSVQPGGTGVAFVAPPGGSCGAQTSNCPALYSLVGGRIVRLTAPSSPCGSVSVQCASEEEDPAVTADGRVVYDRLDTASAFICPFYCGFSGGYSEAYYVRRLDGSDAPVAWPVPAQSSDPEGEDPDFEGPTAADPADPSKLAYQGNAVTGSGETLYPVDVDAAGSSPSVNAPAYDDSFIYGLAFSGDGSLLADIETGGEKGIWVYPSGQQASPSAQFYWALEDPDNGQGTSLDHFLSGLAFVGDSSLVFSADYNLYSLPARCWATPIGVSGQPNCRFPQDAAQLTSDGTASAPDTSPAWTSSTTPIAAVGSTGGGATGGGASAATPPAGRPTATAGVSDSHPALRGVSSGRPQLSFDLAAAAGAPPLQRIVVKLPRGLSFAHSRRALQRGISLRDRGARLAFAAKLAGGLLTILLRKPARELEAHLGYPAVRATRALAAKAAHGKAGKLQFVVTATDVAGAATRLAIPVKPR
jgi:hypothetical protein